MKVQNILFALIFASTAVAAPVAEANALAEPNANANAHPEAVAIADPEADPTLGLFSYFKKGKTFGLYGYSKGSSKKDIYVCNDGRLTYGYIYPGSVKFYGSYYNGCLYGNTAGSGYYSVGCNYNNYFVVGNYQSSINWSYTWNSYKNCNVIQSDNQFYCDSKGYIVKGKPKQCNTCQPIEFECDDNEKPQEPPQTEEPEPTEKPSVPATPVVPAKPSKPTYTYGWKTKWSYNKGSYKDIKSAVKSKVNNVVSAVKGKVNSVVGAVKNKINKVLGKKY